jgi:hypothetical protein
MVETSNDQLAYEAFQHKQEKEWEARCTRCGACCGLYEGDPCEHLTKAQDGRYSCSVYANRFGIRKTVSGREFKCVSIREVLHMSWPGDSCCGYKKHRMDT